MSAPVVADRGADLFGDFGEIGKDVLDLHGRPFGAHQRLVQIGHVAFVMAIVMYFHRPGVDMRFQGVKCIRQRRQREALRGLGGDRKGRQRETGDSRSGGGAEQIATGHGGHMSFSWW